MSQRAGSRFWIAPAIWAVVITVLLTVGLVRLSWPFVDLYNNFYKATSMSWRQTLGYAFGGGLEYRPLLIIGVKLAHQLVGLRVWFYQALVVFQFAAILAALLLGDASAGAKDWPTYNGNAKGTRYNAAETALGTPRR